MIAFGNNENGFSVVEGLLIFVVVILIGSVGWLVYKSRHANKANPIISSKATSVNTTKLAWKPYELTGEKLKFQYPSSWQIVSPRGSYYDPGDHVKFFGNNVTTIVEAGPGAGSFAEVGEDGTVLVYSDPVTVAGQAGYINFMKNNSVPGNKDIYLIGLGTSNTETYSFFKARNIVPVDGYSYISAYMYYGQYATGSTTVPLVTALKSHDYKTFKSLVESIGY